MADTPKVYVICDQNCKFEGMTKEQILTAIIQAVNEGTIGNIDTGFITTIKTINGLPLKFFVGTESEYNALTDEQKNGLYAIITNDSTRDNMEQLLETLSDGLTDFYTFKTDLETGKFVVKSAITAENAENATEATHATTADALTERVVWESTIINNNYFAKQVKSVNLSENCSVQYIAAVISIAPPEIISGTELGANTRVQVTRTKQVKCINNSEHGTVYFTEPCWGTNIHFRAQGSNFLFWSDNETPINGYKIYLEKVLIVGE